MNAEAIVVFAEVAVIFGGSANLARFCAVLAVAFFLSACGEDKTGSVPLATDPNVGSGGNLPTYPDRSASIPTLPNGVQVNIDDLSTFKGLSDFMSPDIFYPPHMLTRLEMSVTGGRSANPEGTLLVSIEDSQGGWVAQIPSFKGASTRTSTQLNMIFADDIIVARVIINNQTSGSIYYRLRVSGDNQCKARSNTSLDVITPCRDIYMNTSNSSVKRLGTFNANYSSWVQ